ATAEADPTNANTNAAAAEIRKMVRQAYNIAFILDDLGCSQPGFMQHVKLLEFVWGELGFASPFPAGMGSVQQALPAGTFESTISLLNRWDTAISTNTQGTDNLFQTLPGGGAVRTQAPFNGSFAVFDNDIAVAAPPPGLAINPPDNGARLANQKIAADALKNIFTYLLGVLNNIQVFGLSLERSAEETLLAVWPLYKNLISAVNSSLSILPPSAAVAGIYARVDNERGVWKAPANVSVTYAEGTLVNITDTLQASLNVDVDAGKSINAIRVFSGKGTMVWGARTLAGNDNEWRYVPVRRFFNMVEESVKKSTSWVVFEPNDANTWVKVKSMIENFLVLQWRAGALAGAKPEDAFFVKVGLNQTMSAVDILEGRLIVQIGMAVVRPAEFIILEFSHKLQTS
ncbi:MAG TPA: phage tail sheath C-terminal domain-containing protein, partial [Phnomibacter sp.]|nr:phage tail sheath C-terminal domain-containing protein [Phnomibacter sp.]